jgi:glutamate--cysteine ligase
MVTLDRELLQLIINNSLNDELFKGAFGLEKENVRVDNEGKLAMTPHPRAFGSKSENPYIKTDFSESQIEMITPALPSIEEAYKFLEAIHDIVTLEIHDEYLWPSSNPPALPREEEIPIAQMNDPKEDQYREQLAKKYGRKKQLLSGIHYNFSFDENFLLKLHELSQTKLSFKEYKNGVYLKVTRNLMKYRWFLIYLTGASPVFSKSYIKKCVDLSDHLDKESHYFPNMISLRNSMCGYRNEKPLYVSLDSVKEYVRDLQVLVQTNELLSVREYYSPIRLKAANGENPLQDLLDNGIAYLELRMFDLNPLYRIGISKEIMQLIHLFIVFALLVKDEPFDLESQRKAGLNLDILMNEGITGELMDDSGTVNMRDKSLACMDEMKQMIHALQSNNLDWILLLENEKRKILNPQLSFAEIVKSQIQESSYLTYHLDQAKKYAAESLASGYRLPGYEDLELSTQLLLKGAIKRGIKFDLLDRDENFIVLTKGDHKEYVKQATKTSLDSYSTVLLMENKIVTKIVLKQHGIRVPEGEAFRTIEEAMSEYKNYCGKPIVIKPKSTNFGLGISIFTTGKFTEEDYHKALKIAFQFDQTVLLEHFVTGKEYRFLVMGEEVVGILHRIPANVIGDGIHTIEQLVHGKNKDSLRGKGYKTPLERIQLGEVEEMFLKNQSKRKDYIPNLNETVYLRENSNISTGGDSIDYTDDIPDSYKQIAVASAKAVGATFCGVDMMIDDITDEASASNYSIIEINFNPAIHIHNYPYRGQNRKAEEKILDLLFGPINE